MARILIVEQDAVSSALLAKTLGMKGYQTRIAANGAAALLAAHEEMPDVILLDLITPILQGPATLHALRQDAHTAHIPVIAFSDAEDDATLAGAVAAGANVYLSKPPDPTRLLNLVDRLATLSKKS